MRKDDFSAKSIPWQQSSVESTQTINDVAFCTFPWSHVWKIILSSSRDSIQRLQLHSSTSNPIQLMVISFTNPWRCRKFQLTIWPQKTSSLPLWLGLQLMWWMQNDQCSDSEFFKHSFRISVTLQNTENPKTSLQYEHLIWSSNISGQNQ